VRSIERALLVYEGPPPKPTTSACRPASPAERAAGPFGRTQLPLFTCALTVAGRGAAYLVQVLGNGCFIAERVVPGYALTGCERSLRNRRLESLVTAAIHRHEVLFEKTHADRD
jgi:hypothetical protein